MKPLVRYSITIAWIVVAALVIGMTIRWLSGIVGGGLSHQQQVTIDSLKIVNVQLDTAVTAALKAATLQAQRADSLRRALRVQEKAATALKVHGDSLEALIPDTATVVSRSLHEAIVAQKDSAIQVYADLYHKSEVARLEVVDSLASTAKLLSQFQVQNAALLAQVNDLAKKANPGLLRRAGYALPFLASLYGGCKVHLVDCK